MLHAVAFVQYLRDEEPRGVSQFGSVNWIMGEVRKGAGTGELAFRGMLSLEPWTIRGCGYPNLLASGEACDGHAIVDRQHPHDLLMELSARYARPVAEGVAVQIYGGLAGEPALGPVAFPHRPSAMVSPIAPIAHHWLDATHLSFGVVTAGLYGQRWKAEGSLFNGREPDDERLGLDFAALDSYSARVTFLPTSRWALQASAGHLEEAEEHGGGRVDVDRATASVMYHRLLGAAGMWATTLAWGRNVEAGEATHAVLAESSVSLADRHMLFARGEIVRKTAHDLDLHGDTSDSFSVGKLQAGYSFMLPAVNGWRAGLGGAVSVGVVPGDLESIYGSRAPLGFGVFLTFRPSAMEMGAMPGR